ncbi:MAG: 50S ribosomal protein L25 [Planctomycetia bacterium]|nr:50S ribosomal protein L25 [Planctomycetia bacterium]
MSEVFHVSLREETGSRNMHRLRRAGKVPAVLYGHGQPSMNLALGSDEVKALVRHGARVVDLEGAVAEKAFVRELQWDTFGREVLHLDLTRVSADERVTVEVQIELKGDAQGVKDGGVLDFQTHSVEIECLVVAIPEKLILRVGGLKLDAHLNADQIELPTGATLVTDAHTCIVSCAKPIDISETAAGDGAEPEVIGRKAGEEAADE